jgi:hypothetical protein
MRSRRQLSLDRLSGSTIFALAPASVNAGFGTPDAFGAGPRHEIQSLGAAKGAVEDIKHAVKGAAK